MAEGRIPTIGSHRLDNRFSLVHTADIIMRLFHESITHSTGLRAEARGWTLDALNILRGIGQRESTLAEVCTV